MTFICKKFQIMPAALAISVAVCGVASAHVAAADLTLANFSSTCTNVRLAGSLLTASCQTNAGNYVYASIDLEPWVTNTDSQLEWQLDPANNGHYSATTSHCTVVPVNGVRDKYRYTMLECDARKINGAMGHSRLLLDMYIENNNGNLVLRTDPHYPPCKTDPGPISAM